MLRITEIYINICSLGNTWHIKGSGYILTFVHGTCSQHMCLMMSAVLVNKSRRNAKIMLERVMQTGNIQLPAIIALYCTNLHIKDFHIPV